MSRALGDVVVSKPQSPDERASGEETSIPEGPQHQGGISKKITTKKEEINPCVPLVLPWRAAAALGKLLEGETEAGGGLRCRWCQRG